MYFVQKNLTRFHNLGYTYFLNPSELYQVQSKLRKNEYSLYYPYPESEKVLLYKGAVPHVLLYEIHSKVPLRHQDILGTMYSLDIASDLFGDVVIDKNHYYVFILPILQNYFESNFLMIRNCSVTLQEIPLSTLSSYIRPFDDLEFIVSSNRIDTVLSSILHVGRGMVESYLKKKDILLNYELLKDPSYKLKEGDTFSIRKVGKFYYNGIVKTTKSNHYIISVKQYL